MPAKLGGADHASANAHLHLDTLSGCRYGEDPGMESPSMVWLYRANSGAVLRSGNDAIGALRAQRVNAPLSSS